MAVIAKYPFKWNTVMNNKTIEHVQNFNLLSCDMSYSCDTEQKLLRCQHRMCGIILRTSKNKTRKDMHVQLYKVTASPTFMLCNVALCRSERWKIETAETPFLRLVSGYARTFRPCTQHVSTQSIKNVCFRRKNTRHSFITTQSLNSHANIQR
jgi:hypothetical protein